MELEDKYFRKIKILNETIWENKATRGKIKTWLENFKEGEKVQALYLLSEYIYFNKFQIESLLVSVYRDLYEYKEIYKIRKNNGNTLDHVLIKKQLKENLSKTRFVSLGNDSESSALLMYIFRTVNNISKNLFINENEIEKIDTQIDHFVFIDDMCGSGSQAISYSKRVITKIKSKFPKSVSSYFMLLATKDGKDKIIKNAKFDHVDSILELDSSYKCFDKNSRIFKNKDSYISEIKTKLFCGDYGKTLMKSIIQKTFPTKDIHWIENEAEKSKYGFEDGQLLIGFHHNTPNNTLPIIWYNEDMEIWNPIFKRHNKVY